MAKKKITKKDETKVLKNQLARALADYDNLTKRSEKEKEEYTTIANFKLMVRILPVLDMLEQTQEHLKDSGLAIAIKEFVDVLYDEEVEKIESGSGVNFDEEMHDVVEVVKGGKEGEIAETVLTGWRFKSNIVIRPAKVKVYEGKKRK